MNSLRLSIACLTLAALAGGLSFLPQDFWFSAPDAWNGALRGLCLAGLLGFAITFMVSLDRRSLVKS